MVFYVLSLIHLVTYCSYVCHAEVNAILNTNHASAVGQASPRCIFYLLLFVLSVSSFLCPSIHL